MLKETKDIKYTGTVNPVFQKSAFSALEPRISYRQGRSSQGRSSVDAAGNTKTTATSLGIFPGARTVQDSVSRGDSDFYSFTIDAVSNVKISFLNRSKSPIYKAVLNEDGSFYFSLRKPQAGNVLPRAETFSAYRRLRPGTYYIKLQSSSTDVSSYKLSVSITNTPPEVDCGCGG